MSNSLCMFDDMNLLRFEKVHSLRSEWHFNRISHSLSLKIIYKISLVDKNLATLSLTCAN